MVFFRKQPVLRGYVSELDCFLQAFDQQPEAHSESRRAEVLKHERISQLRDQAPAVPGEFMPDWEDG